MWWTGMIIMILGELCNFAAYAFVEAIIVVSPVARSCMKTSDRLTDVALDTSWRALRRHLGVAITLPFG